MPTGLTTPEIDPVAISTEVLVNGPDGTGRQAILDLAAQLAATGALADALTSAVTTAAGLNGRLTIAETELLTKASIAALTATVARLDTLESAAFEAADLYSTIADGLAATTADAQFKVTSADPSVAYQIYRHDAGATATLISTVPAPAALADKANQADMVAAQSNIADVLLRTDGLTGLTGFDNDLVGFSRMEFGDDGSPMQSQTANGRRTFYQRATFSGGAMVDGLSISGSGEITAETGFDPALVGYDFAFFGGDGSLLKLGNPGPSVGGSSGGGNSAALSPDIAIFSDSIGASGSGIGPALAALFPTRNVYVEGIGGQSGFQIFQRQGSHPTTGTVAGNTIPASGSVTVTGLHLLDGNANRSIGVEAVTTAGGTIPATLSYDYASGVYSLLRTVAGTEAAVPNPCTLIVKTGLNGTPIETLRACIQVWIAFRNDVDDVADDADGPFSIPAILAMVAAAQDFTTTKRNIIVSAVNGKTDFGNEAMLSKIAAIGKAFRSIYPHMYVDLIGIADAHGYAEPSTPQSTILSGTLASNILHQTAWVVVTGLTALNGSIDRSMLADVTLSSGVIVPATLSYTASTGEYRLRRITPGVSFPGDAVPDPCRIIMKYPTYQVIGASWSSDGLHPSDAVGKPISAKGVHDHIVSRGY